MDRDEYKTKTELYEHIEVLEEKLKIAEWDMKQALATPHIGDLAKSILTAALAKIKAP